MRRPARSTRTYTLFPYTTLVRSEDVEEALDLDGMRGRLAQEIGISVGDGELQAGSAVLDLPHAAELIPVSRRGLIAEPRLALTGHAGGRIRRVIAADIDAVNLLDQIGRASCRERVCQSV